MEIIDEPPVEYLESMEGCEEFLKEFFSGRALFSQKAAHDEQQKHHDEKYERELEYDKKDNAKGKGPYFKQYRKDNINRNSNCDAQYVNNLHAYFGDGSKLKQSPKKIHYAVDLIYPNAVDTDATIALKNLEVSRNKKKVANWVRKNRRDGNIRGPFRRSVSCCDLRIDIPTQSETPMITTKCSDFTDPLTLYDLDADYESFFEKNKLSGHKSYYLRELSFTIKSLMTHVKAHTKQTGVIQISKVLFSRPNSFGYVLPAGKDPHLLLQQFSAKFEEEMNRSTESYKNNFGLYRPGEKPKFLKDGSPEPYYWNKNVILLLEEFAADKTKFRRARHVCRVWGTRQLYLEIDTGMLRVVDSNEQTVRRMSLAHANIPMPILEFRFDGVETQEEMTARIADIRKTGRAFIGRFEESAPQIDPKTGKEWGCRSKHAVFLRTKKPAPPRLTTFFCDELYCMGLCCSTDKFLSKTEIPLTPVGTPTAWIADKEQKKDKKKKFEFPSTSSHLQPIQPLISSFSPRKYTSTVNTPTAANNTPFKSTLEPANMSDFFQR